MDPAPLARAAAVPVVLTVDELSCWGAGGLHGWLVHGTTEVPMIAATGPPEGGLVETGAQQEEVRAVPFPTPPGT